MKLLQKILLVSLIIAGVFTLLDAIPHYFFSFLHIDPNSYTYFLKFVDNPLFWYLFFKLVGTFIIVSISLFILQNFWIKRIMKVSILTAIAVIILEIRYYLYGNYNFTWHLLNVIDHSSILFFTTWATMKLMKLK